MSSGPAGEATAAQWRNPLAAHLAWRAGEWRGHGDTPPQPCQNVPVLGESVTRPVATPRGPRVGRRHRAGAADRGAFKRPMARSGGIIAPSRRPCAPSQAPAVGVPGAPRPADPLADGVGDARPVRAGRGCLGELERAKHEGRSRCRHLVQVRHALDRDLVGLRDLRVRGIGGVEARIHAVRVDAHAGDLPIRQEEGRRRSGESREVEVTVGVLVDERLRIPPAVFPPREQDHE